MPAQVFLASPILLLKIEFNVQLNFFAKNTVQLEK